MTTVLVVLGCLFGIYLALVVGLASVFYLDMRKAKCSRNPRSSTAPA